MSVMSEMATQITKSVVEAAGELVTSQIAQCAAGTILGLAIVAGAREGYNQVGPRVSRAWDSLWSKQPPIIDATAEHV